jgi:hypothetical protein
MEALYEALIQVVRQEAPEHFKSGPRGRKGTEPFNVSKFTKAVWGKGGDRTQWMRMAESPKDTTLEELIKICMALRFRSFTDFVSELQAATRQIVKERTRGKDVEDSNHPKRLPVSA